MTMCRKLLLALVLATAVESGSSSGSSGSSTYNNYNYHLSGQPLTDLYNSRVTQIEEVRRPLDGLLGFFGVEHSGVRATLEDGSQWLVHKGERYGKSGGNTVVTPASDMSNRWTAKDPVRVDGSKTIGDMVRDGGTDYRVVGANCHDARKKMMGQ